MSVLRLNEPKVTKITDFLLINISFAFINLFLETVNVRDVINNY